MFGCVSMRQYEMECVSLCCLRCVVGCLSVSMRWLSCGGDSSKVKTKSAITKKNSREGFFTITVLINSKHHVPHQITDITDLINSKNN